MGTRFRDYCTYSADDECDSVWLSCIAFRHFPRLRIKMLLLLIFMLCVGVLFSMSLLNSISWSSCRLHFFSYLCLSAVSIHMVLWCESFSVWMFVWLACTPFVCYQTDFVVIVRFLFSLDLVIRCLCLSLIAPNTSDCVICVIRLLLLSHNVFFFVYRNAYWWCGLCAILLSVHRQA